MLVYVLGNWGLAAVFGGPFFVSAQGEMAQENGWADNGETARSWTPVGQHGILGQRKRIAPSPPNGLNFCILYLEVKSVNFI